MRPNPRPAGQRGAAVVEVALIVPLLVVLVLGLAGAWRIGWARTQLHEAAAAGARAATLATSAPAAVEQAVNTIEFDLATVNVVCSDLVVDVDTAAFLNPPGQHGSVIVRLGCRLDLADVMVPGLPGSLWLDAEASEALDVLRERTP